MEALFPTIDLDAFHRDRVPELLVANGSLAAGDVSGRGSLALRVGDAAYTYVPGPGTVSVVSGDAEADAVALMSAEAFSDFVQELRSCFGLAVADLVEFPRGRFDDLMRWEPALRALWHGRPIYDDAAADSLAGVDLGRSFAADDEADAMRAFLHRTGYLHVRGVFSPDEMDALGGEVERLKAAATFDDGRSWWARNATGDDVCCRLVYAGERSATLAAAATDPRVERLVALAGADVRLSTDRLDGESVVIKNPDVVEGLSDLPWHRDCGMGGHPVLCPGINVGIQIDGATPDNGQLHFLAGSWRSSNHMPRPGDEERLPVQAVTTEPGDVTVHFGHVLHAAPPPTGHHDGRRTLYATFVPPIAFQVVPEHQGYNDAVLARRGRIDLETR
jgi:ectoine hydroxylase-related dioxygenase (phytanoyl-CoA dioxygenase family)